MAPPMPVWLDPTLLDAATPPDLETLTALGRALVTASPSLRLLRREARVRLDDALRTHGVAPIARHWEGRFDVLCALRAQTLDDADPVDRFNAAALLHTRHALHALRTVLLRVALAIPALPPPTLARAAAVAASVDHALARFDAEVEPWHPVLRRALQGPATGPEEALWTAELFDARAPGANPWWIDVADPKLTPPVHRAQATVGLGATLEAGRDHATWTFERGWQLVVFADARGELVASLRGLPSDVDASRLSVSWIDGATARRVAFHVDEWGDVSARPATSILTSEVVALRDGERFLHRRDQDDP